MRALLKESLVEALIGLAVVAIGIWFVVFAWARTGGSAGTGAIHVTALFPNASGIAVGSDVRIAGLKVGSVSDLKLDPKSFQAEATLALDPTVKVPADSSAAITSEGLLGSNFLVLMPGGDTASLKDGDTIVDTQGAVDLMSMIGQFMNRSGGAAAGGASDGTGSMVGADVPAATSGGATPAP